MPNTRFNPQEALVCAMVLMAAADRQMSDAELGAMSRLVQQLLSLARNEPGATDAVQLRPVDLDAFALEISMEWVPLALEAGVPTKTHVLNLLHRLVDGKTIGGPTVDTPQALILRREPRADVERYDGLRARIAGGRHAS